MQQVGNLLGEAVSLDIPKQVEYKYLNFVKTLNLPLTKLRFVSKNNLLCIRVRSSTSQPPKFNKLPKLVNGSTRQADWVRQQAVLTYVNPFGVSP